MDEYTVKTKSGLDRRFKLCDEDGIYYAFQPIYGYDKAHSEHGLLARYTRTYVVMKTLAHFKFKTLLDAGGAEGYTAHVIKQLFGVKVEHSELSDEACKRAREIFKLKSTQADIHDLPFKDNEFDVVLCSETLEHVSNLQRAIKELLRIADKALVITVPHEPKELIEKIKKEEKFHGHIHDFDIHSFDFLKNEGYHIHFQKTFSFFSRFAMALTEPWQREYCPGMVYPRLFVDSYNACIPLLARIQKLMGKRGLSLIIRFDDLICKILPSYGAILFVISKNLEDISAKVAKRKITVSSILEIVVPYHYMNRQ